MKLDFENRQLIFKYGRVARGMMRAFLAVFAIVFFTIIILVLSMDVVREPKVATTIVASLMYLAVLFFTYNLIYIFKDFIEKNYKWITIAAASIMLILNISFGLTLRYEPMYDLGAIYNGAIGWLENGDCMSYLERTSDVNYFYYFPNNLGGMSLLYIGFKIASSLGISDYFAIATVENAILAVCSLLAVSGVVNRAFGKRQSVFVEFAAMLFLPMYFIAPVFYTDSLSILFPVLIVYLYLRFLDAKTGKGRILSCILIGFAAAIGMIIKFTVLIALIAVIIYHIIANAALNESLKKRVKKICSIVPLAAISTAISLLCFSLLNGYFYNTQLDKAKVEEMQTPILHWVMMSIQGNGRYNSGDYVFTRSFTDRDEQDAAIKGEIEKRIEENGFIGMASLFAKKAVIIFGDGTLGQTDFFALPHDEDTALHDVAMTGGVYNRYYEDACCGCFYAMMALCAFAAFRMLIKKDSMTDMSMDIKTYAVKIIPLISLFGILLFFLFWEVSERYFTNYTPLLIIGAAIGMDELLKLILNKPVKQKHQPLSLQIQ